MAPVVLSNAFALRGAVPVHYTGVAYEMDSIVDIARRHDLLVIEGAAQGVMATYMGRALGALVNWDATAFMKLKI